MVGQKVAIGPTTRSRNHDARLDITTAIRRTPYHLGWSVGLAVLQLQAHAHKKSMVLVPFEQADNIGVINLPPKLQVSAKPHLAA